MTDHDLDADAPIRDSDADAPVCNSDAEVADARSEAAEAGRPLIYVKARGNYAFVETDMEPAGVRLETPAVAEAAELVREAKAAAYDGTDPDQTPVTASADPRGVTAGPLAVPDAEAVAVDLAQIVLDEENWTPA